MTFRRTKPIDQAKKKANAETLWKIWFVPCETDTFTLLSFDRVTITMWKPCTNNKLKVNIKLTDT